MIWHKVRAFDATTFYMRFVVTCRHCGLPRELTDILTYGKCFDDGEYFCTECRTWMEKPRTLIVEGYLKC